MLKMVIKTTSLLIILILFISLIPLSTAAEDITYGTVTGKVLDRNGQPMSGANVEIVDWEYKHVDSTISDAGGVFTFNTIPGGHVYRLSATFDVNGKQYYDKTKFFQVNGLVSTTQDITFINYPPSGIGWLTGQVTGTEHYISPLSATIYLNNGMYTFASSGDGSKWQFNLPEGTYIVWAEHNENNTTYSSAKVTKQVRSDEISSETLYIPLVKDPNATYNPAPTHQINVVHGDVTQRNGMPLTGVLVQLCKVSSGGSTTKVMETTTNQVGYYEFNGVDESTISGNYVVKLIYQVNGKDYSKQSNVFTIYYANTVNVNHDYHISINVDFIDTSALLIQSSPSGAGIWIDGGDTGRVTPYNFTGIRSGPHAVSLQMVGYYNENFTVNVIAENTTRVSKQLKPSIGNVRLTVNPDDSAVYINDVYAGKGSLYLVNQSDGTYTYTVYRDGYRNDTGTYQVIPGEDMNVTVELVAIPGLSLTYISYLIDNMLKAIGSIFS